MNSHVKRGIVCLVLMTYTLCSLAQAINPGEKIPNFINRNVLNKDKVFKLSDYRGKIVLFDMFLTSCIPCIRDLKRLDTLQHRYGDKLQIISVTTEPKAKVREFFERRREKHDRIILTNDTFLSTAFPYNVVPQFIWIDEAGKLMAVTSNEPVTISNIEKLIKGDTVAFEMKKDIIGYAIDNLLEPDPQIFYRFVISHYKPGLNAMVKSPYGNSAVANRITIYNAPVAFMYSFALDAASGREWRTIIKSNHSDRLSPVDPLTAEWRKKNTYCLDLIVDSTRAGDIENILVSVLDGFFNLKGKRQWIDTFCVVLTRTSDRTPYRSKGGKAESFLSDESDNYSPKFIHNGPLIALINNMMNMEKNLYVIDETGIKENVTLDFTAPLDDIEALNKDLVKYDLKLTRERRKVPFVIIEDK